MLQTTTKRLNYSEVLIGEWSGGADDGSGLRTMVYNSGIILTPGGTGTYYSWNNEMDEVNEERSQILWELQDEKLLNIDFVDSNAGESVSIEFEITDFVGAYDSPYYKIVDKGKTSFWNFAEPLYKVRRSAYHYGLFSRIKRWVKRNSK